jgi:aminoglycoside phosphotransferase (APT) family kinase protein
MVIAPNLADILQAIESQLWHITTLAKPVLTHSDLHSEHIFASDDHNLSGIIDFGAAFIATPAWDFAVLAHYFGWNAVKGIIDSYTSVETERHDLLTQSQYLAVVVGLYKLQKAVKAKSGYRKQQNIVRFITETLSALP